MIITRLTGAKKIFFSYFRVIIFVGSLVGSSGYAFWGQYGLIYGNFRRENARSSYDGGLSVSARVGSGLHLTSVGYFFLYFERI